MSTTRKEAVIQKIKDQAIACPSCDTMLHARLSLNLRPGLDLEQMLQKVRAAEDDNKDKGVEDFYKTSGTICTCCGEGYQLHVDVVIRAAVKVDKDTINKTEECTRKAAQEQQRERAKEYFVEQLVETGMLDGFKEAQIAAMGGGALKNVQKMLLNFLEHAVEMKRVPIFVQNEFKRALPTYNISFWSHNGVVGVKAGKEFMWFVPVFYVRGRVSRLLGANKTAVKTAANPKDVEHWIRTKSGYVVGRGQMFNEMKGKRAADFARASGNY
jgi:hypothetical protein